MTCGLSFDTGVVVSAVLLPASVPGKAFDAAVTRGKIRVSEATIAELDDVLRRPKFEKYVPESKRLEFLAALVGEAEEILVAERIVACRDPKDGKFLEVAISGRADLILSSDTDLLLLNPFRDISIQTPAAFLAGLQHA